MDPRVSHLEEFKEWRRDTSAAYRAICQEKQRQMQLQTLDLFVKPVEDLQENHNLCHYLIMIVTNAFDYCTVLL